MMLCYHLNLVCELFIPLSSQHPSNVYEIMFHTSCIIGAVLCVLVMIQYGSLKADWRNVFVVLWDQGGAEVQCM